MTTSSWYRRSLWNYKGTREYTKSGYEYASTKFVEKDLDVDCAGRHYVITGCNSGIGFEIAQQVAKKGGIIHMVCRNEASGKAARSEIITTTGNDKIYLHVVDLARPCSVAKWAAKFAARQEHIHCLINNAGCLLRDRQSDEDGYQVEVNFAVNTLAPYILIVSLLPVLQRNEDARVINVSSAGMLCVRLDPNDLMHETMEPFDGRLVYSQNKRQMVVMTLWFAQRYENVHFSSMHPGWADTPALQNSLPQFYETMKDTLRTPAQGADTAVWLAISKSCLAHPSGLFFQDREPVPTHLPLAWTKSTIEEENLLLENIEAWRLKVSDPIIAPATIPTPASKVVLPPAAESEVASTETEVPVVAPTQIENVTSSESEKVASTETEEIASVKVEEIAPTESNEIKESDAVPEPAAEISAPVEPIFEKDLVVEETPAPLSTKASIPAEAKVFEEEPERITPAKPKVVELDTAPVEEKELDAVSAEPEVELDKAPAEPEMDELIEDPTAAKVEELIELSEEPKVEDNVIPSAESKVVKLSPAKSVKPKKEEVVAIHTSTSSQENLPTLEIHSPQS
ncbi:dehydrogenase/reductase SDR family member 12-like [Homarus americanus]|uniref:dehydrogenase/reductase SDR family member 12-like n=1 Tax=Homarus americanus TaxID=6706 RepID=UPI001C444EDE|nr:dehydrogenase/reductase SDR family member 12-like [Homarus americanus]